MTDRIPLLKAIIANPEDDTPRLVYADFLQENGEDRQAEFIRRSIAHNRIRDVWAIRVYIYSWKPDSFIWVYTGGVLSPRRQYLPSGDLGHGEPRK